MDTKVAELDVPDQHAPTSGAAIGLPIDEAREAKHRIDELVENHITIAIGKGLLCCCPFQHI